MCYLKQMIIDLIYNWKVGETLIMDRSHIHCASSRIDKKKLQGSMINTMFRDDYKVYRTKDAMETVYFLSRLNSHF